MLQGWLSPAYMATVTATLALYMHGTRRGSHRKGGEAVGLSSVIQLLHALAPLHQYTWRECTSPGVHQARLSAVAHRLHMRQEPPPRDGPRGVGYIKNHVYTWMHCQLHLLAVCAGREVDGVQGAGWPRRKRRRCPGSTSLHTPCHCCALLSSNIYI